MTTTTDTQTAEVARDKALMAYVRTYVRASHDQRDDDAAKAEHKSLTIKIVTHLIVAIAGIVICVICADTSPMIMAVIQGAPQCAIEVIDRLLHL